MAQAFPRARGGLRCRPPGPPSAKPHVRHKAEPQGRASRDLQDAVCSVLGCSREVSWKALWFVTLLLTGEATDSGRRVVREAPRRSTPSLLSRCGSFTPNTFQGCVWRVLHYLLRSLVANFIFLVTYIELRPLELKIVNV